MRHCFQCVLWLCLMCALKMPSDSLPSQQTCRCGIADAIWVMNAKLSGLGEFAHTAGQPVFLVSAVLCEVVRGSLWLCS